ncbi:glycosyltransferase [Pseudoalteromonas sp. SG45-5]|uniref:glycosyltransferase family 2 protein n=1 Tax=unclassified Pseudoalteromonas TaxID=194690 RepID=UPI0015F8D408|nr:MULTISPECIES: glycosyltransferase [unclassified Pseudoalteromonas]MBB1384988.1 glycosyltransferase [Pseudoalteromonas sp. SG45-5]MBB1392965.1 glycosyltransferase [Pseudoalteromonas sp. SG44-4]MBB1448384.1 glycosyltransferase [Pseudoalteromonas sp. SG41-6]
MNKLVTVIIPTFKRAEALSKAIESVKNQTYSCLEIIIIDDNDPSGEDRRLTADVMAGYANDERIHYLRHDKNSGACQARNTGLEAAKGEYVAFLDDDDLWIDTKLATQVAALSSSDAKICYSDMFLEYQGWKRYFKCVSDDDFYLSLLKQGFGICTSVLLISTTAIRSINGFDSSLPSMQDYDLLLRLAKKYKAIHIAQPLITYQLADDGISCNPVSKANGHRAVIAKYEAEYISLGLKKGLARQYESLADFELRSGNRTTAITHYFKALKMSPLSMRVFAKLVLGSIFGKKPLEYYLLKRQQRSSVSMATSDY